MINFNADCKSKSKSASVRNKVFAKAVNLPIEGLEIY